MQPARDGLPAPFDLVVSRHVLEHVERPDAFLERLIDLTAPGGYPRGNPSPA
ncbi:MAG: class I SAM-dependent methyltransferase [Candidatus Krumholzibacteriia bacterium]